MTTENWSRIVVVGMAAGWAAIGVLMDVTNVYHVYQRANPKNRGRRVASTIPVLPVISYIAASLSMMVLFHRSQPDQGWRTAFNAFAGLCAFHFIGCYSISAVIWHTVSKQGDDTTNAE